MEAARRAAEAEAEAARHTAQAEAEAVRAVFATEEVLLTKEVKAQAKAHKAVVKELEAKSHRLEGHLGRRQQEAVKEHAKRAQEAKRATLAEQHAREVEEQLKQQTNASKEEAKLFEAKLRTLEAEKLKLQGQVARAWYDAEEEHKRCERAIVVLEKKLHITEEEAAALASEKEHMRLLKNQQAARARQLERAAADKAETSAKRLTKLQDAQGQADELRDEVEQLKEELLHQQKRCSEKQEPKVARRDEDGRFRADPWQHRVLEWAQLARGVAPSTINRNITEVLTLFASEEVVPLACERQMRKLRTEVTIAGEMIAALRVALCNRIISFGFDESTKFGLGLLSTNTQIEPHDAPGTSIDVVMRGVTLTTGGTAKEIAADIDEKLFTHARRLLTLWKAEHERMHAEGSWEKAGMPAAAADGSKLFDPQLDPFAEVAASQPKFAEHRRKQVLEEIKAPDGTLYLSHIRTLEVARSPATEATTPIAVELAQRMANAALVAMRDRKRAIADKLSSQEGANAANAAKSARVHEKTMGAHVMNAHVESHFGKADNCMRTYRNATAENIAGMVQQAYNQDFDQPLNVASDRRKRKSGAPEPSVGGGFFWCNKLMTDELRSSLVSAVRKESESARIEGRKALAAHDTAKLKRREERLATALDAAVDYYAYSKELFEAWSDAEEHGGESQGITTLVALDAALKDQSEAKQLEILRFQIDMRTIALGWDQFKTKWSSKSDATIGTVKHLRSLLLDIIAHETAERRLKRLPTEASPPQFTAKDLGQLGSACADALAIQQKAIFSVEELARKAEQAMARREAAGISDSVERLQPKAAPPFDQQLVGKWLEVLCGYNLPDGTRQLL